jgi:hypothetical protein
MKCLRKNKASAREANQYAISPVSRNEVGEDDLCLQ